MATVALLGTFDTKLDELLFLRDRIERNDGVKALLIDVGWRAVDADAISVTPTELVSRHGSTQDVSRFARGKYIDFISRCASRAVKELYQRGEIDGIASAGGSGGTSIASAIMKDVLPIGFPKLIVSTMASGDTRAIVGETDIIMINPVVDVAGLNQILRDVLRNAGAAIGAAALAYAACRLIPGQQELFTPKKRVGVTMFGVTTPGVNAIRTHLESKYPVETFVFHATGHGGKAMERLIRDGKLDGAIDLTTTEICDLVMGGIMSAGDGRLDAAMETGIPCIISLGATDMANFGPRDSVPDKYKSRKLLEHNPMVTLVRSSKSDCKQIGEFMLRKLRKAARPDKVELWIPKGGVSAIAVPGGPFADLEADQVTFDVLREGLKGSKIKVVEDERDVNDEGFARDIAEALIAAMGV
ncbi:hypothetical protein HRG_005208 [Hirsutella rhossiliensis]|uniref:Uncharacterized protein n=1 Tax=Hirsutella rhossiliensis TaxID=111463 RepID=A0A9P8MV62_9HYPO|nr:uncharacterized protein HRG_05208 [Hirsutella rhossiliensis]KAH0962698.1 hypothetical protein HRG_05208 [Hirsutella rhossiliensis]